MRRRYKFCQQRIFRRVDFSSTVINFDITNSPVEHLRTICCENGAVTLTFVSHVHLQEVWAGLIGCYCKAVLYFNVMECFAGVDHKSTDPFAVTGSMNRVSKLLRRRNKSSKWVGFHQGCHYMKCNKPVLFPWKLSWAPEPKIENWKGLFKPCYTEIYEA